MMRMNQVDFGALRGTVFWGPPMTRTTPPITRITPIVSTVENDSPRKVLAMRKATTTSMRMTIDVATGETDCKDENGRR